MLFHLQAAQGWLELGLPEEAWNELQQIAVEFWDRLEVMLLSLDTLQSLKRWPECAELGEKALQQYPDCGPIYLVTAYAVRRCRSLGEAHELLLRGEQALSEEAMYHFNLACYECQLGDLTEAARRLALAFQLDPKYRVRALEDDDLQPLHEKLRAGNMDH